MHARELDGGRRSCAQREQQVALEQVDGTEITECACASSVTDALLRVGRFSLVRVQVRVEDVEDKGDVAAHLDAPQATAAALLGREARQRERGARVRRRLSTSQKAVDA